MIKISYAIPVCTEDKELDRLLTRLMPNLQKGDEIVILNDKPNLSLEVVEVTHKHQKRQEGGKSIRVYSGNLDGDFGRHKNDLNSKCKGDYIFQIDADEVPGKNLMGKNLRNLLEENSEIDLFIIPRINVVKDIDDDYIEQQRWRAHDFKGEMDGAEDFMEKFINFPDNQTRIYKNNKKIKWEGQVHERIVGFESFTILSRKIPLKNIKEFCLFHVKDIAKQKKQNEFYRELMSTK